MNSPVIRRSSTMSSKRRFRGCGFVAVALAFMAVAATGRGVAAAGSPEAVAREILTATGVKGGLVVHLGCGEGKLTAALRANDAYLVQGLSADTGEVAKAREHIRSLGLYGPVSADSFDGRRLPYADNLVNLIVAEDPGAVPTAEAMRVLAPGGMLVTKGDGKWQKTVKPHPADTDEWTHYLHDASGNAVARDKVVGPPGRVQWIAQPLHTRGHEHTPGVNALVSAGGRIFYIVDEGPIGSVRQPPKWHLAARDAYNGLLLWKRALGPWYPHIVNWGQTPTQLQRRLLAVGERVYVTLGLHAPLSAVDAATGKTVRVYEQTRGAEEAVCHKGILLVSVCEVTDERVAKLEKMAQLSARRGSPLYARESADPLVKSFSAGESKAARTVLNSGDALLN